MDNGIDVRDAKVRALLEQYGFPSEKCDDLEVLKLLQQRLDEEAADLQRQVVVLLELLAERERRRRARKLARRDSQQQEFDLGATA